MRRERWKRIPPRYLRSDPTRSGVKENVPPCHRITLYEREVEEEMRRSGARRIEDAQTFNWHVENARAA